MKLKNHPYAQCDIRFLDDGTIILRSYSTDVIKIDAHGWLNCYGLYSCTTRRHITWFLHEYAPILTFSSIKRCYEENRLINVITGAIL